MYDGDNDADDLAALFDSLPPEVQEQLIGMGTLDERGAILQQQMAQAEALRQPSGRQYSTPGGAIFGGLANGIRAYQGTRGMEQAQAGLEDLLKKKDEGRMSFAKHGLRRPQQNMQNMQDVIPAVPFGL